MAYKKTKNKCSNLVKKSRKTYFQENGSEGSPPSKSFWNTTKTLVDHKGTLSNDNIVIGATNDTTLTVKGGILVSIKAKYEIRDEEILVEEISGSAQKLQGIHHVQTMINVQSKISFSALGIIQV